MQDNTNLDYCKTCSFRRDRKEIDKTTVSDERGRIITLGKETLGNKDKFCEVGYKVNPKSLEATVRAILNGSKVCRLNPWLSDVAVRSAKLF